MVDMSVKVKPKPNTDVNVSKRVQMPDSLSVLTAHRRICREDHWRSGGYPILHQISGIPADWDWSALLWSNLSAPTVGGVCCPLLETVRDDTRRCQAAHTLIKTDVLRIVHCVNTRTACFSTFWSTWCLLLVLRSNLMKVVLSEHSLIVVERFEQVFNVSKIYVHNYNYKTFNNDIMLIKVSRRVGWTFLFSFERCDCSVGISQMCCHDLALSNSWANQHCSMPTSSQLSFQMKTPLHSTKTSA